MDKTALTARVAELMSLSDHDVSTSVLINFREIDVVARERFGVTRKTILIECADYAAPVGIAKLQEDLEKLRAAQREYGSSCTLMHISANGYSQNAAGYARSEKVDALTISDLTARIVNFEAYLNSVDQDPLKPVILSEYQPTRLHDEGNNKKSARPALDYLRAWLETDQTWLTVLGDYGVGKSWMLRRLLYNLVENYRSNPTTNPVPIFIPLQRFHKSFDLSTLITTTLQHAGVQTLNYAAFEYLASTGRVVYLLDSFDEMAQNVRTDLIRQNLAELLVGVANGSKAIMTSRPNYFESRAERLIVVEQDGELSWQPLDNIEIQRQTAVSRLIEQRLSMTQYARLNDLSHNQRVSLFQKVLGAQPQALRRLEELYARFQSLESVSQRAVIARLLTTVAETLSEGADARTPDGYDLLAADVKDLNEGKIFELVINALLLRDLNSGSLRASDRHRFLSTLAVYLQQPNRSRFASPKEIRDVVGTLFSRQINESETPSAIRDSYYRTCRRHSGLTTEGQFQDTSGAIDLPVDDYDRESPVGFSHNAIREYLVADAIAQHLLHDLAFQSLPTVEVTEVVANFFADLCAYRPELRTRLRDVYANDSSGASRQFYFQIAMGLIRSSRRDLSILGAPPSFRDLDLASTDLSGLDLSRADLGGTLLLDTDLRKANLRSADLSSSIVERLQLDETRLEGADFREADVISIYVHDRFIRNTTAILAGKDARQWLFSSGARVQDEEELNPYLGQEWYEAAREIARTLSARMAGSHQSGGLVKGTKLAQRRFAEEFRDFLLKQGMLIVVGKKTHITGESVLSVAPSARNAISTFASDGTISDVLQDFFAPLLQQRLNSNAK